MRILVAEDDQRIASALKTGLEQESYAVDVVHDGLDAYNSAAHDEYDVIICDVMMPEINGYEVVKKLRDDGNHTPILLLTAKGQNADVVRGLNAGADDYMQKPFSFEVLLARIRALLRRPQQTGSDSLTIADVTIDFASRQVERAGQPISLSAKEYAVLEYLARNRGKVLSKHNIMTHVWDFDADILPNNVEVFITYLRSKIDKPFDGPNLIQTVHGFGYKVDA